jgi:hypothetical protein
LEWLIKSQLMISTWRLKTSSSLFIATFTLGKLINIHSYCWLSKIYKIRLFDGIYTGGLILHSRMDCFTAN